ncbi:hypothetical protein D030_1299B, partial [Vibrio parahaemolyticus AQ3810]
KLATAGMSARLVFDKVAADITCSLSSAL